MNARADWERCKPWLVAALAEAHGTHVIEDVEAGIEKGEYQFFAAANCAVITEIWPFPRLKVLNIFLAGGNLAELLQIEPALMSWGQFNGCTRATITGRGGWVRALKSLGWLQSATVLGKSIEPGTRN